MIRSSFSVVAENSECVFLKDNNVGKMSVTNDAESVYEWCQENYPNKRVVYKDSMNEWREIIPTKSWMMPVTFLPFNKTE